MKKLLFFSAQSCWSAGGNFKKEKGNDEVEGFRTEEWSIVNV